MDTTHTEVTDTAKAEMPEEKGDEKQVYELGFHVVPRVGEEKLPDEVGKIRSAIEESGAVIFAEEFPEHIDLAYPMQTTIARERHTFDTAFFGWMKFESTPESVDTLKQALDTNEQLIRFLIVKTIREATPFRKAVSPKNVEKTPSEKPSVETPAAPKPVVEEKGEMDKEAVDAEIEKLVVE